MFTPAGLEAWFVELSRLAPRTVAMSFRVLGGLIQ